LADNSKEVLILGNGVSRRDHEDFIDTWPGPIWACNWAYLELVSGTLKRIDRLLGDKKALIKAIQAKQKYRFTYEMISKIVPQKGDELYGHCRPAMDFGIERKHIFDSGSALVEIALREGYDKIYLAGFDLGGKDLYITDHEFRDKSAWVRKWRQLYETYGLHRIEFLGYDHKWYIQSELPPDYYSRFYTRGMNHLADTFLEDNKLHNEVIILENGKSRLQHNQYIRRWDKEIWVTDGAFIEHNALPAIHRVGTVQNQLAIEAEEYKRKKRLDYEVYSRDMIKGYEDRIHTFQERRGWLTGPLLLSQAIKEKYNRIYLIGFDLNKEDLYGRSVLKSSNYANQLLTIKRENPEDFKNRVHLLDDYELRALFDQEKEGVRAK
jgi:hypothetical protein